MKKLPFTFWVFVGGILLLVSFSWLRAIHDSQVGPHWMTVTAGGKLFKSYSTTNPVYFSWMTITNATTNGMVCSFERHTTYYWAVWRIWK
jgi:hypothetical protein